MNNTLRAAAAAAVLALIAVAQPASAQTEFNLQVNFEFDSTVVDPARYDAQLAELAQIMKANDWLHVLILAYADDTGSKHYNDHLSQRRAKALVDKMAGSHGVPRERFNWVGLGISNPVASNDSSEGRAQNRRAVAAVSIP